MASFKELGLDVSELLLFKFESQIEVDGYFWVHDLSSKEDLSKHLDIDVKIAKKMTRGFACRSVVNKPDSVRFYATETYGDYKVRTTNFGGLFDELNNRISNLHLREKNSNYHLFWRCLVGEIDGKMSYNNINIASMVIRGATGEKRPQRITYKDLNPRNVQVNNLEYGRSGNQKSVVDTSEKVYDLKLLNDRHIYITMSEIKTLMVAVRALKLSVSKEDSNNSWSNNDE